MADRRTDVHSPGRARDLGDAPRSARVRSTIAAGPGLSEIGVPAVLDPVVTRPGVAARLDEFRDQTIVLVDAPAGYGKTTAIAQYAMRQERPTAWLTVAAGEHALPSVLLALLQALEGVQHLHWLESGYGRHAPAAAVRAVLTHLAEPMLLVVDDAHHLGRAAELVIPQLARIVPVGSQLVVAGRAGREHTFDDPALDAVARLSADVLAMNRTETSELLDADGVHLTDAQIDDLLRLTEGWPAALALASSALADAHERADAVARFGAADRLVEDYIETQVLAELSPVERSLLVVSSIADAPTGDECDALLETNGAARVLARLSLRLDPLVAMTDGSSSFHVNPLLREALRAELGRQDVEQVHRLLARASRWSKERGRLGDAITYASEAGDHPRVAALAWRAMTDEADGWATLFEWLPRAGNELIAGDPALCICAAFADSHRGDLAGTLRWLHLAERSPRDVTLPDGAGLEAWLALLHGYLGRDGTRRMLFDAKMAALRVGRGSGAARTIAEYLQGCAHRLRGHPSAARARFEALLAHSSDLGPMTRAHMTGQLALLVAGRGDRREVGPLISELSAELARYHHLLRAPARLGAQAALALLRSWYGSEVDARESILAAQELMPTAGRAMPWITIDAHLLLGEALVELGDIRAARAELREADEFLRHYPDPGTLTGRLVALEAEVARRRTSGLGGPQLTAAERRVLEYLPTHLTFPEIAEALFVSRHTVKTQAAAVYRKLGVASRSTAVDTARQLGYLDD